MYIKEAEIVNEEFLAEENTYNLKVGGLGGWDYANSAPSAMTQKRLDSLIPVIETQKFWLEKYNTDTEFREKTVERAKKLYLHSQKKYPEGTWKGKKHKESSKQKISEANSIKCSGKGNSQYGTMWIFSEKLRKNKKIKKTEPIPEGWEKGRKTF